MEETNQSEPSTDGSAGTDGVFTTDDAVELYTERVRNPTLFPQERKIVERYFADTEGSVLDVGCGVGRVSSLLHDRGFDVTGIDVSEPLVEKARSLFPDVEFRVGDVRDTDFEPASFDYAVFSYYGLDYLLPKSERVAALRELYRVLKPSGIVAFSSHNNWSPLVPLSSRDLRRAIGDVGDFYKKPKNHARLFSRYKFETVPLGELEVYLSNPLHQWLQLRKCGFTLLDVVGEREGVGRFFERDTHYVAKK
ncbi:class I SAM-dependent methyltransferase [Halorussus gelatinilyticus]|uniref:Class I SAM-dependent methyltransferase n=1 Tax=Halorussus gelatinilyticus TaxID=2937524 RepID=A0A8U0IIM2_9EURY|nr:class I SAM-dependent methyltransferase [Halorussus gelatinilyticus]UPW00511.1 class I SAM-dependent methyltransferase [Halorussus gelatinilyticus]